MTEVKKRGSLFAAMNWMAGLSLLLFWLPVAGPLIAGFVGGRKAGSIGRAILAVFLPAVLLGIMVIPTVAYLTDTFFWGILAGVGTAVLLLLNIGPLLAGAIVGGLVGEPEAS